MGRCDEGIQPMTALEKRLALEAVIADAKKLLLSNQESCVHPNYLTIYDGYGNGYDYNERYWVTLRCPDCGHSEKHESRNDDGSRNEVYYDNYPRV